MTAAVSLFSRFRSGIDSKFTAAYDDRGKARAASCDIDGAIADFTGSLEGRPESCRRLLRRDRGCVKQRKADLDGALLT